MLTAEFKNCTVPVSKLGMGCMRLPVIDGQDDKIDKVRAQAIIDRAVEGGITYFDTAHYYHSGESQIFMGEALASYSRDRYLLATKMPVWGLESPGDLEKVFEEQLKKLRTDYFDFYLLHALNKELFEKVITFDAYGFIAKKKAEGYIRNIGFSFHDSPDVLQTVVDRYDWDFAQLQINYVDWEKQQAKQQHDILRKKDIPCIIMEPVRGGKLANPGTKAEALLKATRPDKSVVSWALRFAGGLPGILTVLSGMTTLEQLEENIAEFSALEPLSADDLKLLEKAADAFNKRNMVPCTACGYCIDCPSGVDIPGMFELFNRFELGGEKDTFLNGWSAFGSKTADSCIKCGVCLPLCPQGIEIPAQLEKVAALQKRLSE